MAPKWVSKVPWTTLAEFLLSWWKGRKAKKDDKDKTGSSVQPTDDEPVMDTSEARPIK